ncbi:hypothetical protein NUU61_004841 [Penicillium alfredii]|uniref:F-BAR domain-containing protein n=1 Tax=Penicillium alfredii TaxID=1506179 RepID=A0A9W9F8I5_9EURO|nr:uncharacterized protein NUU61_004841 [Penicillium alfredii]KAJ5095485.1 hypothetical protein NUU61_004841 [Penicillium alfredii]
MPGTVADGPTVSMSFANNFWGKDDAGVQPMLDRMHGSKSTSDELKAFYNVRAAIEDEYARKLQALCRKSLGSCETGSLRTSLDVVRGETEAIAKAHSAIAGQMKSELEEPLVAFASGLKERRKIIQTGIERLHKTKVQQTQVVNKTRDRYEQDCLRIKGYLAQGHMVMGQEERKNKAKLEKTQIQLASNSNDYEAAVKTLEETTGRWNKEWKSACDKFQDLEEERLDFTKSSLWTYANIASTVCVSDDASCEKIRLSLENCEVEKDIVYFIKERGTGQEIPDPPRFINFCRGDVDDAASDMGEEDGYSVAQFQRTMNPAFRTSSPQPSTFESHNDPQSDLAAQMGHAAPPPANNAQQPAPLDLRRGGQLPPNYDPDQHGEINAVPHNAYPADGMTMFCRAGPPSERSSATSAYRPSSRDSQSEVSNPTSMSSVEPVNSRQSPTKPAPSNPAPPPAASEEKQTPKKRTTFFSNSPFRRKSRHEKERPTLASLPSRSGWDSPAKQASPAKPSPSQVDRPSGSPEPVDPRANFQLNVGNNVFDVASPEKNSLKKGSQPAKAPEDDLDPIARALADLKTTSKQSANRVSADRYHGIQTPTPCATSSAYGSNSSAAAPPPAYNDPTVKRLDAPQPAFTSKQMQKTTQRYTGQAQSMLRGGSNNPGMAARDSGPSQDIPRARSPAPAARRSASPQVSPRVDTRMSQYSGGRASPSPSTYQSNSMGSRYSQSPTPRRAQDQPFSPNDYNRRASPAVSHRAVSPQPQFRQQTRPSSAGGMELQLSGNQMEMYGGGSRDGYGSPRRDGRPMSYYGDGGAPPIGRTRSRTLAVADPGRQFSRDGRPILHFARAMYSYTAAIPEELGFTKGDVLAVLRLQDDGWWEAEVTNSRGHPGLVPSNYLQII